MMSGVWTWVVLWNNVSESRSEHQLYEKLKHFMFASRFIAYCFIKTGLSYGRWAVLRYINCYINSVVQLILNTDLMAITYPYVLLGSTSSQRSFDKNLVELCRVTGQQCPYFRTDLYIIIVIVLKKTTNMPMNAPLFWPSVYWSYKLLKYCGLRPHIRKRSTNLIKWHSADTQLPVYDISRTIPHLQSGWCVLSKTRTKGAKRQLLDYFTSGWQTNGNVI